MKDAALERATAEWRAAGQPVAEAVLVRTQHSSPRQPGARLRVDGAGRMAGGVSMGCVENDLREHLLALLAGKRGPGMVHYGRAFAESLEVGLSCGGEIDVWLRVLPEEVPSAPAGRSVWCLELGGAGREFYWKPGEAPPAALPGLEERLEALVRAGGSWTGVDAGGTGWFLEGMAPEPRVVVVGASPIAVALSALAARAGWRVAVVDPRREWARAERFPDAEAVIHEWPEEGLATVGAGPADAVAVLAHDEKLDVPALAAALRAQCGYVGLLGSRGTQEARKAALAADGFGPDELSRIRGPIGMKELGGVEPEEIAVGILAELVKFRRGRLE